MPTTFASLESEVQELSKKVKKLEKAMEKYSEIIDTMLEAMFLEEEPTKEEKEIIDKINKKAKEGKMKFYTQEEAEKIIFP